MWDIGWFNVAYQGKQILPADVLKALVPYKGMKFRTKEFSDLSFEFVRESGDVTALKEVSPSGEYTHKRKKE